MTETNLLIAAILIFTMLVIGLVSTVLEFRRMRRNAAGKPPANIDQR